MLPAFKDIKRNGNVTFRKQQAPVLQVPSDSLGTTTNDMWTQTPEQQQWFKKLESVETVTCVKVKACL